MEIPHVCNYLTHNPTGRQTCNMEHGLLWHDQIPRRAEKIDRWNTDTHCQTCTGPVAMQLNTGRCHDNLFCWIRVCILVAIICANQSESKFLSLPLKSCLNVSQENQSFIFNNGKMKLLGQLSFCPLFKLNDWFAWETNLTGFQWTWIPSFRLVGTNNYYQNEMTTTIKSPGGTVKQHVLLRNK